MATKAQAVRSLKNLGFEFDESVSGKAGHQWMATMDAIGRRTIEGDCRGIVLIADSASELWSMAISEARSYQAYLGDCPHPLGKCDFHDAQEE